MQIVDAEAEDLTPEQTAERVVALNPRLVTVVVYGHQPSASTQNMTGASAATTALKNLSPSTKVLMLGGHVAALQSTKDPDLSRIRGLVYRKAGGVVSNPAAPLVTDVEHEMPGIAWDLLPMTRYRAHNWHG